MEEYTDDVLVVSFLNNENNFVKKLLVSELVKTPIGHKILENTLKYFLNIPGDNPFIHLMSSLENPLHKSLIKRFGNRARGFTKFLKPILFEEMFVELLDIIQSIPDHQLKISGMPIIPEHIVTPNRVKYLTDCPIFVNNDTGSSLNDGRLMTEISMGEWYGISMLKAKTTALTTLVIQVKLMVRMIDSLIIINNKYGDDCGLNQIPVIHDIMESIEELKFYRKNMFR